MTREEAHRLLDGLKAGVHASLILVNEALMHTGDLDFHTTTQVLTQAGQWERGDTGAIKPAEPFDCLVAA